MRKRVVAAGVLLAAVVLNGRGEQTAPAERAWPPSVQQVSDESPPLPPADALKTFYLLNREPIALTRRGPGDQLAPRVSAVLARVSWPGKHGDPAPLAPLTAEEQRRFDAGRELYRNICQGCHQPDGRGQDQLAPTLIGAAFTVGPPEIPARILLNGKEGAVGLMPPLGSKLTDEQIACVLTYVRREWGQTATPVDVVIVKNVRELSSGHRAPWTDDELMKLANQPRR